MRRPDLYGTLAWRMMLAFNQVCGWRFVEWGGPGAYWYEERARADCAGRVGRT